MAKSKKVKIEDMPEDFHEMVDSIMGAVITELDFTVKPRIRKRIETMMVQAYEAGLNKRFEAERLAPKNDSED